MASCYELALTLPDLWREREALDIAMLRAKIGLPRTKAELALTAAVERTQAVAALILETQARTLEDAAAQLLVAYGEVFDSDEYETKPAERAIISAFFAVASAAGVNPHDIAFDRLAPYASVPGAITEALAEKELSRKNRAQRA